MNILLTGGPSGLRERLIRKFKKEGHRVCLLTGSRFKEKLPEKVFEAYWFPYDSDSVRSVFESVLPDITIFLGAYDPNFRWEDGERASARFTAALSNLLMSFGGTGKGRFLFLSSEEVYGCGSDADLTEEEPPKPTSVKGIALAQGEALCGSFGAFSGKDVITLRLQNLYGIPEKRSQCSETLTWLCLEALRGNELRVDENRKFALLYETDAVEYLYDVAVCRYHEYDLYHLSSSQETSEAEIGRLVLAAMREDVMALPATYRSMPGSRCVLSNRRFAKEFGATVRGDAKRNICRIAERMKAAPEAFLTDAERRPSLRDRLLQRAGWFTRAMIPFLENLIGFSLFFLLYSYASGSGYLSRLDAFLLYVLLFAAVHGQQQAVFSAVLASIGCFIRFSSAQGGFTLSIGYDTYIWIAQLFIVGLVVGRLHDRIQLLKDEAADEQNYMSGQLADIRSINESNVRVKDALTTQIINHNDSIGKIYSMTSVLDQLMPEEVLFRAASVLGGLMDSKDVAIYTVSGPAYARLFSATSRKARTGGNSIRYMECGEMSEALKNRRPYINRSLDARYPMMASAIYNEDGMQAIVMIWSLPWDHMTLGQADYLVICGRLIQNAVVHANRYLSFQEKERYLDGMEILNQDSFRKLVSAFLRAKRDGLTECSLLEVEVGEDPLAETGKAVLELLRASDYVGEGEKGELLVLLANTDREEAAIVQARFEMKGLRSQMREAHDDELWGKRISDFTTRQLDRRGAVPVA